MLTILSAIVPIFLIVALGFLVTRAGVLSPTAISGLAAYVVKVGLPALIFVNIYGSSLSDILNPTYLLTYALAAMAMVGVAKIWSVARQTRPARAASISAAMSATNNGFVGFPIFLLFIPQVAGLAVGMDMLTDNTLIIPVALIIFEAASADKSRTWGRRLTEVITGVLTHPMVIAIALALALTALQITLPDMIDSAVTLVADSSPAVALMSIGGMLVGMELRGQRTDLTAAVVGKLVVMPVIALALVLVLPLLGMPELIPELKVAAVLTAALPSMSLLGPLSQQYGDGQFGAAAVMLSTLVSFVTITVWMFVLVGFGWV